ncbi:hypothetical protein CMO89_00125 [Candidatus Woesearchaeota archaeon]|jgi:flavin reductase (DIM6/NTAB) family NADH-FMN oxidoreductase RutF|nr:hypothetical protein [Candidatus Woesearchaeota archaeon]|tara:strand:+ start:14485 stop:15006 length:522 start_codon:yes stop_codon:yes gene_type:complete
MLIIYLNMLPIFNPRQTILVTCREKIADKFTGREHIKDNIITLDWHMPVSFQPFLYAIAIGKKRFSHNLIKESMVFVVNFMPYHLEEEVLDCGRHSGAHMDKFEKTGLAKEEADRIDCPRIRQALAILECEIINSIDAGDHTVFISKVVHSEEKEKGKRLFHTEGDEFTTTKE